MRIANSNPLKSAAFFVGAALMAFYPFTSSHAADVPSVVLPPSVTAPGASDQSPTTASVEGKADHDMTKNVSTLEDKVSDNVKSTLSHYGASTDAMTLDDLNALRQTVVRIEAMIDVEKHMAELEKLRNERTGRNNIMPLANAIPASALGVPGVGNLPMTGMMPIATPQIPAVTTPTKTRHGEAGFTVSRIIGSEGKYLAVFKLANGTQKTAKVGDTLPGGEVVRAINFSSVELEEDGETRTLHIENVDAIYSAMR